LVYDEKEREKRRREKQGAMNARQVSSMGNLVSDTKEAGRPTVLLCGPNAGGKTRLIHTLALGNLNDEHKGPPEECKSTFPTV